MIRYLKAYQQLIHLRKLLNESQTSNIRKENFFVLERGTHLYDDNEDQDAAGILHIFSSYDHTAASTLRQHIGENEEGPENVMNAPMWGEKFNLRRPLEPHTEAIFYKGAKEAQPCDMRKESFRSAQYLKE